MKKLDNNQPDTPQDAPDEFETGSPEQTDQIIQIGGVTASKGKHVIHCLTIIGQIEGHYILPAQNKTTKYEHVIPQLLAVEQDPEIEGLVVILNTVGGDVEGGACNRGAALRDAQADRFACARRAAIPSA